MASPAAPIQRKSIHSLSTAIYLSLALLLSLALSLSSCAGRSSSTSPTDRVLTPNDEMITLRTNQTKELAFELSSGGVLIGGQRVMFTITDGSGNGGYVQPTEAVTDAAGVAKTVVHGGSPTTFRVRAWTRDAMAYTSVSVDNDGVGSVAVMPFFLPTSENRPLVTEIEVLFMDRKACADFVLVLAKEANRAPLGFTPDGKPSEGTDRFDNVSTKGSHAVIGIARAHKQAVATGCVDLPGDAVVSDGVVQLGLPLADAVPDPVGRYAVTTLVGFFPPLADAVPITTAYRQLSDCPLDPAELLLDCTVDALSPATADDPLDCVPAPAEGPVAAKLAARRGAPIVDGAGVATGCRGARSADGRVSFDAIVLGLYGSPKPSVLVELPAIAHDAAHLFDLIKLVSTLELRPAGIPSSYTVTHTLVSAEFANAPADLQNRFAVPIDIPGFPVPVPQAFGLATTAEDELLLGELGFTLRLGSLARAGFTAVALDRRGIAGGATGLMTTLAGLARSEDGTYRGCAAIDHALCAEIGEAPGCLVTACGNGMMAFADLLDEGFAALDGAGLDLYLAGSAVLHDTLSDGTAGLIGAPPGDTNGAGTWSFELRTRNERRRVAASFGGVR